MQVVATFATHLPSMAFLKVSEIYIYPVKSLGGISLASARVMAKGLENDRRWMLIDEQNIFLTQRVHHRMALFRTALTENGILVSFDGETVTIPFGVGHGELRAAIWDDQVSVQEVDDLLSNWFSSKLGISCRLVVFPERNARPIDARYKVGDDHVSLADGYPMLAVGQSSLDDLNARLSKPVLMNRFRPSVVITGGDPFEEDTWKRFTIGSMSFAGVKPCKRCVLITVNQEDASRGAEPLATLSKFRNKDNGVYFGQNVIPLGTGSIAVGDSITIHEYAPQIIPV